MLQLVNKRIWYVCMYVCTHIYIYIYIYMVYLLVWIIKCTRCTVHTSKKYLTVYWLIVREDVPFVSKSYTFLYTLVTDRSAFIHTFFPCLYRRLPSELHHTALFYIMLFHSLPHCMVTHTALQNYCGLPSSLHASTHFVTRIGSAFRRTFWTVGRWFEILNLGNKRECRAGVAKILANITPICDKSVTTQNLWLFRRKV